MIMDDCVMNKAKNGNMKQSHNEDLDPDNCELTKDEHAHVHNHPSKYQLQINLAIYNNKHR